MREMECVLHVVGAVTPMLLVKECAMIVKWVMHVWAGSRPHAWKAPSVPLLDPLHASPLLLAIMSPPLVHPPL